MLDDVRLDQVDPATLGLAVANVEEITLTWVQLSITYEAIFRVLSQCKPKLKKLIIEQTWEIMDWVRDVDSMAQAVCLVQDVELNYCDLSRDQLEAIFRNISTTPELHLQNLTIDYEFETAFDLSGVSPEILASAVCRLKRCNLGMMEMTSEQLEELCREIVISKNLPLSYLSLYTPVPEDVRTDILASAVVRLEVVELYDSTDAQLHAILSKVVECNDSKLKELYLYAEKVDEEEPETRSLLLKVKDKLKIFKCDFDDYILKQVIV